MYLSKNGAVRILQMLSEVIESMTIYDTYGNPYSFTNLIKQINIDEENKEALLIVSAIVSPASNIEFNRIELNSALPDGAQIALFYENLNPPRVLSHSDSQVDVILRLGYSDSDTQP